MYIMYIMYIMFRYIMFYVRSPREQGEVLIGSAMSLLWMVVHSVQGIGLKDLKQILRKEQVNKYDKNDSNFEKISVKIRSLKS